MAAAARIEWNGVPIDVSMIEKLRDNWDGITAQLVEAVNRDYGVFVPTVRDLDPHSRFGAVILHQAEAAGIDPYALADVVDYVWQQKRTAQGDTVTSIQAARKATGLTATRIAAWENSGRDSATWPRLDALARNLAAEHPELGIGPGYCDDYDDRDYAGEL